MKNGKMKRALGGINKMCDKKGTINLLREFHSKKISTQDFLSKYPTIRCPTAKCGCQIILACPSCVHGKMESDLNHPFVLTCNRCRYLTHGITCRDCRFFIKATYLNQKVRELEEIQEQEAKAESINLIMLVAGIVVFFVVFSIL
jgi:hypothetical protein